MTCKKEADCVHGIGCFIKADWNVARCSAFKRKSQEMTNEEYIRSCTREELVDLLYEVHKGGSSVERQAWIDKHKERVKMQIRGWLKQTHEEK